MEKTPGINIKTVLQKIGECVGLNYVPKQLQEKPVAEIRSAFDKISTCCIALEQSRKTGALAPYSTEEMHLAIKDMAKVAISMKTALSSAAKDREQLPLFIEMMNGLTVARLDLMNHVCSHIFLKIKDGGKTVDTWDSLHAAVDKVCTLSMKHLTIQ